MTGTRPPKTEVEVAIVFAAKVGFSQSAGAMFKRSRLSQKHLCWLSKKWLIECKFFAEGSWT